MDVVGHHKQVPHLHLCNTSASMTHSWPRQTHHTYKLECACAWLLITFVCMFH
jgi:hypothetical protein